MPFYLAWLCKKGQCTKNFFWLLTHFSNFFAPCIKNLETYFAMLICFEFWPLCRENTSSPMEEATTMKTKECFIEGCTYSGAALKINVDDCILKTHHYTLRVCIQLKLHWLNPKLPNTPIISHKLYSTNDSH